MNRRNKPNRFLLFISVTTILILGNWINNLYDDINDKDFKIELSCIRDSSVILSNIEKDRVIDSLVNYNKKEIPIIIKPKYKKSKVDTTTPTIIPTKDTLRIIPIDISPIEDTTKNKDGK